MSFWLFFRCDIAENPEFYPHIANTVSPKVFGIHTSRSQANNLWLLPTNWAYDHRFSMHSLDVAAITEKGFWDVISWILPPYCQANFSKSFENLHLVGMHASSDGFCQQI